MTNVSKLEVLPEGVIVDGSESEQIPWTNIIGAVIVERELYLLASRPPPLPPWFRLRGADSETTQALYERITEQVAGHTFALGYRSGQPRERVQKQALLELVQSNAPIEGSVEVSVTARSISANQWGQIGGVTGFLSGVALALGFGLDGSFGLLAGAVGAVTGGGGSFFVQRQKANRSRAIVLTPDGGVFGFADGVTVFNWSELAPLKSERRGEDDWIVVEDTEGTRLGRLSAEWINAPAELVVGFANLYRARVT